ncbi:MAG: dTDP-4-dehydrorhamnose reductase [bacterium]|nr:dTDP-4-dehydrorhamnose reductase [bacterium]
MKILLIGSTGQLGSDILRLFEKKHSVVSGGREIFDIRYADEFGNFIKNRFSAVINCAAFLDVPLAEKSVRDPLLMNYYAPMKMAGECRKRNVRFIHFSTDYVFDGKKNSPYIEDDSANPLNVYGMTKYMGERGVLYENPSASVMRVSGLYGKTPSRAKGYNFISLFLDKAGKSEIVDVVGDEILTPTSTRNIARQTLVVLENGVSGIIHSTDEGEVSWHSFAEEIASFMKLKVKVNKTTQAQSAVSRPKYSVLENRKLKDAGLNVMKDWKASLHEFLREVYL